MLSKHNIETVLDEILDDDEQVCWEGKPDVKTRLISIFVNLNLWGVVGIKILGSLVGGTSNIANIIFKLLFFVALLWYLYCVVRGVLEYTNTYYIVSNKAVYRCGGDFKRTIEQINFTDVGFVEKYQSIIDGFLNTGSVFFSDGLEETSTPGEQGFLLKIQNRSLKGIYILNVYDYDMVESIGNSNIELAEKYPEKNTKIKKVVQAVPAVEEKKIKVPGMGMKMKAPKVPTVQPVVTEEPKKEERPKTLDERRAEFLR
ncbi:MAG: hypothetical protein E7254_09405 [Lachnospiraceae bacterium]|nr:hypothetical protein [Lachnospiraceae bacterium]